MHMKKSHILIVDDNEEYSLNLRNCLSGLGNIDVVHREDDFRTIFSPYKYDLIFLDLRLRTGKEGLDLLDYIIAEDPLSSVIVISGYGDIATAVETMQKGAKIFLDKNKDSFKEVRWRAEHVLKESEQERRIRQLESAIGIEEIIGNDPKIKKIRHLIKLVAQDGETTVLIRGETGTGKELVARGIHKNGTRSNEPFIAVALTDTPETISSELFGHEKGAFTGAQSRHYGYFEQAHKGVLFIDEIGDLGSDIQLKLLRVIDQRSFRRMGGSQHINVDVQVVTATNRSLDQMIQDGSFREDLYYRLKVFEIHLPPLRERKGDIPLLAEYFLHQLRKRGKTPAGKFTDSAMNLMHNYRWPGNVRELESVVKRAALICKLEGSKQISKNEIEQHLLSVNSTSDDLAEIDILKTLTKTEFELVEKALVKTKGRKLEAAELLNYKDHYSMRNRIKSRIKKYADLLEHFPEIKKAYCP